MTSVGNCGVSVLVSFAMYGVFFYLANKVISFSAVSILEISEAINEYIFCRKTSNGIHFGVLGVALWESFRPNKEHPEQTSKNDYKSGKHEFHSMNEFIGKRRLKGGDVTTVLKCLKDSCKEGRECSLLQVHLSSIAIRGRYMKKG